MDAVFCHSTNIRALLENDKVFFLQNPRIHEMSSFTNGDDGCVLRILSVNDVYEIDYWPNFSTANKELRNVPSVLSPQSKTTTISVLPGDFLSPSLLSSLDKGKGMVECMNESGLDYVCIGNHEADIALEQLHLRIRESTFEWINTNMRDLPVPSDLQSKLPEFKIIEVSNAMGDHVRRIALVGLCCEDPSVFKSGAFGGCAIVPVLDALKACYKRLVGMDVDCVIPLTHQVMPLDRLVAADADMTLPVIIGGHDHEPYLERVNGCTITKVGADAKNIGVIELYWPNKDCAGDAPQVRVVMEPATSFHPCPALLQTVTKHKAVLVELEKSVLCPIPSGVTFSSLGMRLRPNSVGTFVCQTLREEFGAEVCLIGAGSIRGNRSYAGIDSFTYAHLKAEIPFDTPVVTVHLPGQVIADMVAFTRAPALLRPPVEKGGYLQTCDAGQCDHATPFTYYRRTAAVSPHASLTVAAPPYLRTSAPPHLSYLSQSSGTPPPTPSPTWPTPRSTLRACTSPASTTACSRGSTTSPPCWRTNAPSPPTEPSTSPRKPRCSRRTRLCRTIPRWCCSA